MKVNFVAGYNEVTVNDENGKPLMKQGIHYTEKEVPYVEELYVQWNKINDLLTQAFDPKNIEKRMEMIDYICLFYTASIKTNYPWVLKYASDVVRAFITSDDNGVKKSNLTP